MGESLKPQLPESTYFTAFIVRLYSDYSYSYVNGGHQKAIHIKNNGNIELLDTKGLPLGILNVAKKDYEEKHGKLETGDLLVLLTDGITEQKNLEREEYGKDNFLKTLLEAQKTLQKESPDQIIVENLKKKVFQEWNKFKGDAEKGDDISMLMLQRKPSSQETLTLTRAAKNAHKERNDDEAYRLAKSAYKIDPSLKDNLLFLGKLCYNQKNFSESMYFIDEYIKTSGEDTATIHYLYAKSLFKGEKIPETKRALKKALSCDPSFTKASLLLAKCYLIENSLPKAIKTLQQGIKSSPSSDPLKTVLVKLENVNQKEMEKEDSL